MPAPDRAPNDLLPLRFDGVAYAVGETSLLTDLDFELEASGISVILGPNGAGKTLTLRLAHGLLSPTRGSVSWAGGNARARAESALVFQRPVLLRRSARANIEYALALRGVPKAERGERALRALAALGLADRAQRGARKLSGGEQQRLALARARALEPRVLFLDEPAASLDPGAANELEASIRAFHADGTKIIMTTHDLAQAERMADEILLMHRGRLVELTPASEFFRHPRSDAGRKFLARELID